MMPDFAQMSARQIAGWIMRRVADNRRDPQPPSDEVQRHWEVRDGTDDSGNPFDELAVAVASGELDPQLYADAVEIVEANEHVLPDRADPTNA